MIVHDQAESAFTIAGIRSGVLHAEFTILCEASAGQCEKFRSDVRGNVVQLSKMMAGDPPVKCSLSGRIMKCEPVRATGSLD
jgi:hypothetical protein